MTQVWKEISFIHKYFYDSNFTFDFIENYYRDLRSRYGDIGQTASLYDIYSSIKGKGLPSDLNLPNDNYRNIEYLIIDSLDLDNLFPLDKFYNLRQLKANANKIDSIIPLKKFTNIINLNLSGNKISNIEPLGKFHSLRHLDLCNNSIFDVRPIAELENLWTLDIQANKIDYLPDLSQLKVLQELYIGNNNIKSLHGLTKLNELKKLHLGLNPLPDEELVLIKSSLSNCEIILEYYPPDEEGLGKYVQLRSFEEIIFLTESTKHNNESYHTVYYVQADNNKKALNNSATMKRLIEQLEMNNSHFGERSIKRKHYWSDTDMVVSCQIEY